MLPSWAGSRVGGPGATIWSVKPRPVTIWTAALFVLLLGLELWKFGSLKMQVHVPIVFLAAAGLVVGVIPVLRPWRVRGMFFCAYATAFLWLWATGQPEFGLRIGRAWLAMTGLLVLTLGTLVWRQVTDKEKPWSPALVLALGFGLWVAFISGSIGSAEHTRGWVDSLPFLKGEPWQVRAHWVAVIRKSGHFCGYGTAALVTAVAVRKQGAPKWLAFLAGYAWPLPLSLFDEWRQGMSPGREGQFSDVVLDATGMTVFLLVLVVVWFVMDLWNGRVSSRSGSSSKGVESV